MATGIIKCNRQASVGQYIAKIGNNITFETPAGYNENSPLATGNLILDSTGGVAGVDVSVYYNGNSEPQITGDIDIALVLGHFVPNKLNIYNFLYNTGGEVILIIISDTREPLSIPDVTLSISSPTSINISFPSVNNANNYEILFNTINDLATASSVPGYNGTDLTYNHTSLTTGQNYFYWIKAKNTVYGDSPYFVSSVIPQNSQTPVLDLEFIGSVFDSAKVSTNSTGDVTVTQNDEGIFSEINTVSSGVGQSYISTSGLISINTSLGDRFWVFDINRSGGAVSKFVVGLIEDSFQNNIRLLTEDATGNNALFQTKQGGTNNTAIDLLASLNGTYKISLVNGTATLYKWNDGTSIYDFIGSLPYNNNTYFFQATCSISAIAGESTVIDNVKISEEDWLGRYPNF